MRHARYSTIKSARINELLGTYQQDADPLDLLPELALLRSLVHDFIERYDDITQGLIRWNRTFDKNYKFARSLAAEMGRNPDDIDPLDVEPTRPDKIVDILQVGSFITQIGNLSERIYKRREQQTFTMATVSLLIEQMGAVLLAKAGEYIDDPGTREAFLDAVEHDWQGINVAALARRKPQEDEAEGE